MTFIRPLLRWIGHQHYIRFGIRNRIIRFFHPCYQATNEVFVSSFYNYKYKGNFNSLIDWSVYYFGAYSPKELSFIGDIGSLLTNAVFVDVGANVGNHSLFASSYFQHVYSFEPVRKLAAQLEAQCQLNAINNIRVYNYALGDTEEVKEFYSSADANQGTGSLIKDKRKENEIVLQTPVRTGDNVLNDLNVPKVDFIKIDVEGYERPVLVGLKLTLKTQRPVVFFEWNENDSESPAELFPVNYNFFEFVSSIPVLGFFEATNYKLIPTKEFSINCNYVAMPSEHKNLRNQKFIA